MEQDNNKTFSHVIIHTDGAAEPNPGSGGYGVVLQYGKHRKELSGGFERTTNNRMELMGAIVGLETLTARCSVRLYSDSKYLVDSVNQGSVFKWRQNDWYRTRKERAKNIDLWQRFLDACERHEVTLVWVKGHAGNPDNECCDRLALAAAKSPDRQIDTGYVESEDSPSANSKSGKQHSQIKHKQEGEPCRKCQTSLVKRSPKKKPKPGQAYYYQWYLYCPNCRSMYMVEEAKRFIEPDIDDLSEANADEEDTERNRRLF